MLLTYGFIHCTLPPHHLFDLKTTLNKLQKKKKKKKNSKSSNIKDLLVYVRLVPVFPHKGEYHFGNLKPWFSLLSNKFSSSE